MEYKRIEELTSVVTGGTPSTSKAEYWEGGDIPWLQSGCCQNCDVYGAEKYITQEGYDNSSTRLMPVDTVMIALTGATAGKIGYLQFEACGNQSITGILPCDKLDQRYLFYYLLSQRNRILADCIGGAQPHISQGYVKNMIIPVPTMEEQRIIVGRLKKLNNIISQRQSELVLCDDLIKARFVEMFGNPFDNTKWQLAELKNLSDSMIDGSNVDPNYYELDGEVLFLRIQNVWRNEFRLDDSVYITQQINQDKYKDTSLKHGDLLITKIGRYYTKDSSLGRVSVYRGEDDKANYSNNIMRVRLDASMNSEFVNVLLNLDDYQSFIKRTSKGGTDKRALSKSLIGSYPIICPPKELQDEFVVFVEQVDKSKVVVQKALDEAQLLFDSLMQEYFG